MVNITRMTEDFIKNKLFIKQAIKGNVINYSKLARLICKEKKIDNFDAVLIAIRRYSYKLRKSRFSLPVMELLKGSKLSIRNKIVVIILEPDVSYQKIWQIEKEIEDKNETINIIRGANGITIVTTEDFLSKIERIFKHSIIKISKGLVEIMIKTSSKVELTSGVMGYIYSLFGENDVNILETMSCWTDTLFVIKEKDLSKTMGFLSF